MSVKMSKAVGEYLKGVEYPAGPEGLLATAKDNAAPISLFALLGLLPTAVEFHNPDEVAEQLERTQRMT
jgi:hypothetical protein